MGCGFCYSSHFLLTCLEKCGNISAASVPILLDEVNKAGMLNKGDKIVLAGFGAGLTWGAALVTW